MIALKAELPLLRVGDEDLVPLEGGWVEAHLRGAAAVSGHQEWLGAGPVTAGLFSYLRHNYPATAVSVDFLNQKLRPALAEIGYPDIADSCHLTPPAVAVDLRELAIQSGALWLAFAENLQKRLVSLRAAGVAEIRFERIRAASQMLTGARHWSPKSAAQQSEIISLANYAAGADLALSWQP
jgi:hypothetical protein